MDNRFEQFIKKARKIGLAKEERSCIKDNLVLFMDQNPVRYGVEQRQPNHTGSIKNNLKFLTFNFKTMPIFIVIAMLVGGGVSFAAEKALPGDVLYPVKVHVNEEVRGLASLSPEAKANWEAMLAARRLEEAEELAVKSNLSSDVRAGLESNFQEHADKAQAKIASLKGEDAKVAADIASNLAVSLRAHDHILLNIGDSKKGEVRMELNSLSAKVQQEERDAEEHKANKEDKIFVRADVQSAAEARMNAANNKIAEVQKFIDAKKADIGATATTQIQARLDVAKDLVVQGKAKLDAKAYGEAFLLFGKAHAKAQEAKLLVEAKSHFEEEDKNDQNQDDNKDQNDKDDGQSPSPTPSVSGSSVPTPSHQNNNQVEGEGRVRIHLEL